MWFHTLIMSFHRLIVEPFETLAFMRAALDQMSA